jgi:hypothetical protein
MSTSKRQQYFQTGMVLAISLLLWTLHPVSSFAQQNGGSGNVGEEKTKGITMMTVSGRVIETMNSGGYTYALVNMDDTAIWVALPVSRIAVGNEIACKPGMVMNNFRSTSLNRSFTHIVFSGGIISSSGDPVPPTATPAPDETTDLPKIEEPEDWRDF